MAEVNEPIIQCADDTAKLKDETLTKAQFITRFDEIHKLPTLRNSSADPMFFACKVKVRGTILGEYWFRAAYHGVFYEKEQRIYVHGPYHCKTGIMTELATSWNGPDELCEPYRTLAFRAKHEVDPGCFHLPYDYLMSCRACYEQFKRDRETAQQKSKEKKWEKCPCGYGWCTNA